MKLASIAALLGVLCASQHADAFGQAPRSKVLNDLKDMRMVAGGAGAEPEYSEGEPSVEGFGQLPTSSPIGTFEVTWNHVGVILFLLGWISDYGSVWI